MKAISPVNHACLLLAIFSSDARAGQELRVSHLMVRSKAEAQAIRQEVLADGGDRKAFTRAVRKYSLDPLTKRTGGDLGWMTPEKIERELSANVLQLKDGELSAPIDSGPGWHLAWMEGHRLSSPPVIIDPLPEPPPSRPAAAKGPPPTVTIKTSKGEIMVELFENDAPNTVAHFIELFEHGFFSLDPKAIEKRSNMTFYRVDPGNCAISGSPTNDPSGGPGYRIRSELDGNGKKHEFGTLTMLLEIDPSAGLPIRDSAGSQFMICLKAMPCWDGLYTPFGRVTGGLDVLERLNQGDGIESVAVPFKGSRRLSRLPLGGGANPHPAR